MKPTLPPRLLGHLREMLADKEEDINALKSRLQTSEELQGQALARLERLEVHFGFNVNGSSKASPGKTSLLERLEPSLSALEQLAMECRLLGETGAAGVCDGSETDLWRRVAALESAAENWKANAGGDDTGQQLMATQRLVEQLRDQLHLANAGRAQLLAESDHWQGEAQALRVEADALRHEAQSLRSRATASQASASSEAASASREADSLRSRLSDSAREASLLRSQLASREADVSRLEHRVAELESSAGAAVTASYSSAFRSPVSADSGSFGAPAGIGNAAVFGHRCEKEASASNHSSSPGLRQPNGLDETRQVQPGELQEELASATVTMMPGSSRSATRQISPAGVRRQVTAPAVLPWGTSSACTSPSDAWPDNPEDPLINRVDSNRDGLASRQASTHGLAELLTNQRVTVPSVSRDSPGVVAAAPSLGAPNGARTPPTIMVGSSQSRSATAKGPSATRFGGATSSSVGGSHEWASPKESAPGPIARRISAPSKPLPESSAVSATVLLQQPSAPSEGVGQRSHSVPVGLRSAGSNGGTQVQTVNGGLNGPNGVSLARWAASPGSSGTRGNIGTRLTTQSSFTQASPFLGVVRR